MKAPLSRTDPLIAVIGPSGTGKSTVVRALAAARIVDVTPSWTTRPARPGEEGVCVEHRFVTDEEFDTLQGRGAFAATIRPFDLPYRYGLPAISRPRHGAVALLMLRAALIPALRAHYDRPAIYQIEDSRERVADRLLRRHRAPAELGTRLIDYDVEVALGRAVADRVFVNDRTVPRLVAVMREAIATDFGLGVPS